MSERQVCVGDVRLNPAPTDNPTCDAVAFIAVRIGQIGRKAFRVRLSSDDSLALKRETVWGIPMDAKSYVIGTSAGCVDIEEGCDQPVGVARFWWRGPPIAQLRGTVWPWAHDGKPGIDQDPLDVTPVQDDS